MHQFLLTLNAIYIYLVRKKILVTKHKISIKSEQKLKHLNKKYAHETTLIITLTVSSKLVYKL